MRRLFELDDWVEWEVIARAYSWGVYPMCFEFVEYAARCYLGPLIFLSHVQPIFCYSAVNSLNTASHDLFVLRKQFVHIFRKADDDNERRANATN